MRLQLEIVLTACWVLATPGWARDFYVDNVAGDDRYDGMASEVFGQRVGPHRTITRALKAARKGDRVILAKTDEAYRESITLQGGRRSGSVEAPFELIGNGAVLDGAIAVPAEAWLHFKGHVFCFRPPKKSFQVLFLGGKPAERRVLVKPAEIEQLQPRQWGLFQGHIYFCVDAGRLPQSYELTYTGLPVGITLYEVRHVVVRDLVIQGFQLDGVNAHDAVAGVTFRALKCRGNGRSGISVGGASRVRIEACLVGNNGAAQVRTEGSCHAQLIGCDLLDNTAPKIVREGGEVVVDP